MQKRWLRWTDALLSVSVYVLRQVQQLAHLEGGGDGEGVLGVLLHAYVQRLEAAQHHEAVKRGGHRTCMRAPPPPAHVMYKPHPKTR